MSFRTMLAATVATTAIALVTATAASAHVTVSTDNPTAGGYALLTIKVPHGCEGAPTNRLEVKFPDGVTSFAPERNPFWTAKVNLKQLDEPIDGGHGEKISEAVDTVVYTASTPLPDGDLDILNGSIKLPDTEGDVFFPVVQGCPGGKEALWNVIPEGDEEVESPAPGLVLAAATEGGHGAAADDEGDDEGGSDKGGSDEAHGDGEMKDLEDDVDSARTLGITGIVVGALGLLFGLVGFRRKRA
jgi:uncharacterized protein YcnI